jgi:hypothetical protein
MTFDEGTLVSRDEVGEVGVKRLAAALEKKLPEAKNEANGRGRD